MFCVDLFLLSAEILDPRSCGVTERESRCLQRCHPHKQPVYVSLHLCIWSKGSYDLFLFFFLSDLYKSVVLFIGYFESMFFLWIICWDVGGLGWFIRFYFKFLCNFSPYGERTKTLKHKLSHSKLNSHCFCSGVNSSCFIFEVWILVLDACFPPSVPPPGFKTPTTDGGKKRNIHKPVVFEGNDCFTSVKLWQFHRFYGHYSPSDHKLKGFIICISLLPWLAVLHSLWQWHKFWLDMPVQCSQMSGAVFVFIPHVEEKKKLLLTIKLHLPTWVLQSKKSPLKKNTFSDIFLGFATKSKQPQTHHAFPAGRIFSCSFYGAGCYASNAIHEKVCKKGGGQTVFLHVRFLFPSFLFPVPSLDFDLEMSDSFYLMWEKNTEINYLIFLML